MKIAFDAKRAFCNPSGLGNYSRMVIRQLCEYYPENEYLLYSPQNGSVDPDFPPPKAELKLPETFISRLFNSYWRSYSLKNILINEKPDIFHGLSNELPLNIHRSNIKSVVTIHDLIFIRFPDLYKHIDRNIYLKKFKYASKNADIVIAVSEQTKRDLIHFFNTPEEKIKVVYQSGDPLFSKKLNKEEIKNVREK
ncbi:MAG: glycosyltransferase, partial [Bacteroidota bacterium]